jgi:hypothetical protein
VLVSFEDVTRRVRSAIKEGATASQAVEQRRAATAAIEKESTDRTGLRSEVVALYNGGEYWLYRYKKYTDLRIVFAPEEQIAFFGGDYDNFTYPRYDLDVAFFRAYENDRPVHLDHYFKWSAHGPDERELVFVPGNPGSTARLLTVAQIQFQRDYGNPIQIRSWTARRDALVDFSKRSEEAARAANEQRRSLDNSLKRINGQQDGLLHQTILDTKAADERALKAAVASNPEWQREFGSAWDEIEQAYRSYPPYAKRITFSTLGISRLGGLATTFIRYSDELRKPDEGRLREYRGSQLESLRFQMLSRAPIERDLEEALLAAWFGEAQKALGPDDPFVRAALSGASSPSDAARLVVQRSRLADPAFRKELVDGGPETIARSEDPMLALARRVEPIIRDLRAWQERTVLGVETSAGDRIARARFAVYGRSTYPDATFSPRIGYGTAVGYEHDTTLVPFKTTFYGLYERAQGFGNRAPFELPARYLSRRDRLDLSIPLNFVYTADTIGGNSGSPVINRNGEVVGLHFDSNIQKLANRYAYIADSEGSRGIAVHSAGILEALRHVYETGPLVEEILAGGRK